jgi:aspartate aminotransferase-like enzyme
MKKAKLFTPGPTAVPPEVLETQARPLIHHRTGVFRDAHREVVQNLQYIMRTNNPVAVLTSSGTGAMEACVVNLTKPGNKVLATVNGKFSERWAVIARTYGLETVALETEWGEPVTPDQVARAFEDNSGIAVMFTTHSETSTGVLQDVAAFARIARDHGALIVVDGITSIGAHDVLADEWGLDAVVGGSQKGVMTPPGLAYVSLSPAAIASMKAGRHPCHYFDLLAAVKAAENGDTPYTPAISLFLGLQQALRMIREEGIENVVARHAANAAAVRAAVRALDLELLASVPSNATTAVVPREGTAPDIAKTMERKYGVKIAGGQGRLKGKIVRLGHLGYYDRSDMHAMITALEGTLVDLGITKKFGDGLDALRQSYEESGA